MKQIFITISLLLCMITLRAQVPTDTASLRQMINTVIVTNGQKGITATKLNQILNGMTNLMKAYAIDSAYKSGDTLVFVRRGGFTSIKLYSPGGGSGSESDPTVPTAVKSISQSNINFWNNKQNQLAQGVGIIINSNLITADNATALWNAAQLQGKNISPAAPVLGQCLIWNGSAWAPGNCGGGNTPTALAFITQPNSQSITEGNNATFSTSVTGGSQPYSYQWQKDGSNISGATSSSYSFTTTSSSGGAYRVIVTDALDSSITSNAATLTINAPVTIYWGYYASDPFPTLQGGTDNLAYNGNFTTTNNSNISVPFPEGASDRYWVVKVPTSQSLKTKWFNTNFNYGDIPDQVWQESITIGSFRYYVTRVPAALDFSQPVILQQ